MSKKKSDYFARIAAKRKSETKKCSYCPKMITGIMTKRYCDEACKQRAKRHRAKTLSISKAELEATI